MSERKWRACEDERPDAEDRDDSTQSGRRIGMLIIFLSAVATAFGLGWLVWSAAG